MCSENEPELTSLKDILKPFKLDILIHLHLEYFETSEYQNLTVPKLRFCVLKIY